LNSVVTGRTIACTTGKEELMDKAMWDRLAAAGGIVGVALFVVAAIVYGTPPDVDSSAASVTQFFQDNSDRVLTAVFLQGLAVLAILWFVAALVTAMRDAGEPRLATAGFGAFLLAFSIGAMSAMALAGLAFTMAGAGSDLASVAAIYHLARIADTFSGLLFAGLAAAVAGASFRTKLFPAWWAWLSALIAAWSVVAATGWAQSGFWSPDGVGFAGFAAFLLWTLVTSVLLTMRTKPAAEVVAQPTVG
jgi:hypothetical protein